jgi:hypothetical protein
MRNLVWITRSALALCGLLAGVPMSAYAAPPCEPAHASASQGALPNAWRDALNQLIRAGSGKSMPWDCSGAEVELVVDGEHGELRVHLPDGRSAVRPVVSSDLVVPVGEALLAQPDQHRPTRPVAPTPPQTNTSAKDAPKPPAKPTRGEPRLLIDAGAVGRVGAAVDALWAGGAARVTIPFTNWAAAAWVRVDGPVKVLDTVPKHFTMSEVCLGLAIGYRVLHKPFELRISGDAGFGVIRMSDGENHPPPLESTEGSRADFRTGADLQAAWPFARIGRFVAGGDFEVTPARLPGRRTIRPELPEVPGFSAGITLGMGVAIP